MPTPVVLVDAEAAATAVDRPLRTVYGWARDGRLEQRGSDGRRALYALADVQALADASPARPRSGATHLTCATPACPNPALHGAPTPICHIHLHALITWAANVNHH